jgi:hypothetical protein
MLRRTAETGDEADQSLLSRCSACSPASRPTARTRALLDQAAKHGPACRRSCIGRARIAHAEGATPAELLRLMTAWTPTCRRARPP